LAGDTRMRFKPLLMGLLFSSALMSAQIFAQSLDFTVKVGVSQSACTPNISGQLMPGSNNTSNLVTLPNVNTMALDAAGKAAGAVTIQFRASGCTGNVNNMWVHFTSANADGNGRIAPSGGGGLRFEIRDNTTSGSLIRVGGSAGSSPNANQGTAAPFSGSHPANASRVANKNYGVRYYAQAPVLNPGTYQASVTANFKYY